MHEQNSNHVSSQQHSTKLELLGACWMIQYLCFGSQFFIILCLMWTFYIISYKKRVSIPIKLENMLTVFDIPLRKKKEMWRSKGNIFFYHILLLCLFDSELFQEYNMKFVVHLLEHTTETYPVLDKALLKTEAGVIYKR
ncbi:hypothetical protein PR048_006727 [Dryococelus australis]|uniref:Uncharacterized protein n=1 Tax=Dryococelus australis TaxID=614101 RepID=A0ABQ9IBR3_9NEOP|nr:hypothetical protein PR048_006727 [Dryococelus australis]